MTGRGCGGRAVGSEAGRRDWFVLLLSTVFKMVATAARSELPDEEVKAPQPPGSSDRALFAGSNVDELGGCFIVVLPSYCVVMLA